MLVNKMNKAERLALISKILVENPAKLFTLQYFSEMFSCAKSTLSEDVDTLHQLFKNMALGDIQSISGASGGIIYLPTYTNSQIVDTQNALCEMLSDPKRIIPGGYLYTNDLFYDPARLSRIAKCILTHFVNEPIDYVVTIETKGIPLATTLAIMLNKPVVVIRKSARLTEGPTLQMNYVTGSSKSIKTMAMPIKAMERGSKILFVDDFMKAGGTAKGAIDLMKTYDCEVIGVAVVMVTKQPQKKLIDQYFALIELEEIDEEAGKVKIMPKRPEL